MMEVSQYPTSTILQSHSNKIAWDWHKNNTKTNGTEYRTMMGVTMEFYSATKKNEILLFTSKSMELETIILSKVSQA
jgi:hypothetical protein